MAIGAAIIAVGGAIKQSKDIKAADKRQSELDDASLANYQLELGESISRTETEQRKAEGQTSVQASASGFGGNSSLDKYIEGMKKEHASDIDWMQTSGASMTSIMERESAARSKTAKAQASSALIGGIGSAVSGGISAYGTYQKYGW